ncbi:MAG: biotin--[acetyl-CoA-carboxylase] ligase [Halanaeroarchaeum sp.]
MQETRREILDELATGPVPGPVLAERLGVSRAAVWKHVEALREDGFEIGGGEDGYELASVPEYGGSAVEFGLDAPVAVEYHDTIASTNSRARERAEAGDTGFVILADEQTGGRGRRGRGWNSPSGGVWMSVVLSPTLPPARVPLLTFAAAVAVAEAAANRGVEAGIKWPNDVVVSGEGERGGRKLAGVLTEMAGEAGRVFWVIVGVGINANVDPDDLPPGATSLQAAVDPVDRRSLVQEVLDRFWAFVDRPDAILPAWSEHAITIDQWVRIETARETFEGQAVGVTDTGALRVATDAGERTVHAGDCEHLRPA